MSQVDLLFSYCDKYVLLNNKKDQNSMGISYKIPYRMDWQEIQTEVEVQLHEEQNEIWWLSVLW